MKLFKHKKNDRKENIKTKAEQATVILLTKIFQRFGVNNACERLLAWADIHRKAMFGITISFLSLVTFLSIVMRPSRKPMQVFNEEKNKIMIEYRSIVYCFNTNIRSFKFTFLFHKLYFFLSLTKVRDTIYMPFRLSFL